MVIVWNIQRESDRGAVYPLTCSHCRNEVYYRLVKRRVWAWAILVPIPYRTAYVLRCPVCSAEIDLRRDEIAVAKQLSTQLDRIETDEFDRYEYLDTVHKLDELLSGVDEHDEEQADQNGDEASAERAPA